MGGLKKLVPQLTELPCYLAVLLPLSWIAVSPSSATAFWTDTVCTHLSFLQLTFLLPFACAFVWYFIPAFVFFVIDVTQSFGNQKIQPKKATPSIKMYTKVTLLVLFNFIAINLPLTYLYSISLNNPLASASQVYGPVPSITRILRDIAASAVLFEISFYYTHRLFHYPPLYKIVHKKHHEFLAPMGVSAIYAHPLDHLLTNMVGIMSGPVLMKSHVVTLCFWIMLAVITTVCTHSGYILPGAANAASHDLHHSAFNVNFGVLGVLDWLHGTDRVPKVGVTKVGVLAEKLEGEEKKKGE
ncbi:Chromosome 5 4 [Podochytrium sp. JEL0797]|nr:Chromosome 5 4 [Podochytrium sp. JEL0797]